MVVGGKAVAKHVVGSALVWGARVPGETRERRGFQAAGEAQAEAQGLGERAETKEDTGEMDETGVVNGMKVTCGR